MQKFASVQRAAILSAFTLLLLAAAVLLPASARSVVLGSDSGDGWSYGAYGTKAECIKVTKNGHELVYAHLTTTMFVHNRGHFRHWATAMRLKARMVPSESGENFFENWTRSWKTTRYPVHSQLLQDYDYSHAMAVNTDTVNPEADWEIQDKYVWDRQAPLKDIVHQYRLAFNTNHCRKGKIPHSSNEPPATPGALVPQAPGS